MKKEKEPVGNAMPDSGKGTRKRSDWKAAFEAILRIDTNKYGDRVRIESEFLLGVEPPRADYIVLIEEDGLKLDKDIFDIFRRHNIIELKNPDESLSERTLRKAIGYANFYIGVAKHEGDIPSDEVTLSIFRAVKPVKLLKELASSGKTIKNDIRGIYLVEGVTDLPLQIIVTTELEGEEYAAYRALSKKASEEDTRRILTERGKQTDAYMMTCYNVLINMIFRHNGSVVEAIWKEEPRMYEAAMEYFRDEIERVAGDDYKQAKKTIQEQSAEIERMKADADRKDLVSIQNLMETLHLTADKAMDALKIPKNRRKAYASMLQNL